jgi:two-component system, NarL family, response regulator DesR
LFPRTHEEEDQAVARGALAAFLALEGTSRSSAVASREDEVVLAALDALPDAALLDIEMPGGDGLAAATAYGTSFPPAE